MVSGGARSDIRLEHNLTQGEVRVIRHTVVDADDEPILNFAGWEFAWYLLPSLCIANGIDDLDAVNYVKKSLGNGISASAPDVDIEIGTDDIPPVVGFIWEFSYEFWRTDAGNERRLAYGIVQLTC